MDPSGGLISEEHPLGASGLAQCVGLVSQLRGWATRRLVAGAVVVTVYKRADGRGDDEIKTGKVGRVKRGIMAGDG